MCISNNANHYYSCRSEIEPRTDVFLSHNWGKDESGRDNRQRVTIINKELKARGYKTWFDEEKMSGNIDRKMAQGIAQTEGVVVFLTRKYQKKVNGNNAKDNCQKEFMYATRTQTRTRIVAVVMEKCMCNISTWSRLVDFHLGGEIYVDMSGDFDNKTYLSQQMEVLVKELQCKGIHPVEGILSFYYTFQYHSRKNCIFWSS